MLADGLQLLVLTNPVSIRYARLPGVFRLQLVGGHRALVGPIIMHGAYIEDLALVEVSRRSHAIRFDAASISRSPPTALPPTSNGAHRAAMTPVTRWSPHHTDRAPRVADIGLNVFDAEPTIEPPKS